MNNVVYTEKNNLGIKVLFNVVTELRSTLDQTNGMCQLALMGMKGLGMRLKNLKQRSGLLDIHVVTYYGIWKSNEKN